MAIISIASPSSEFFLKLGEKEEECYTVKNVFEVVLTYHLKAAQRCDVDMLNKS